MRIALMAPLYESVPPKLYGGTERVVANLCRGLTELGHEVTLFASADSHVLANLVPTVASALRLSLHPITDPVAYHFAQLAAVARRADQFDVLHNHMDYLGLPLLFATATPLVTTLHGRLDLPDYQHVFGHYPEAALVSISDSQRGPLPDANWVATVHHGLPLDDFRFTATPGTYLTFLGRISPEKRPDLAIDIALQAGIPLKIAAKVENGPDKDYFDTRIKPRIDGRNVEFIGEITEREKSDFLGGALAMTFPIDWPEPFGIAPVEAWACGTPVLARPCGSVLELHRDGLTGFVRREAHELAALVPQLAALDRRRVRAYAERRFSLHKMCGGYLDVYQSLARKARGDAKAVQPLEPAGGGRGLLYPVRRHATGHRESHLER